MERSDLKRQIRQIIKKDKRKYGVSVSKLKVPKGMMQDDMSDIVKQLEEDGEIYQEKKGKFRWIGQ